MHKWKRLALIVLLVAALAFAGAVVAALALEPSAPAADSLSWQVIASGGQTMSGGSYTMLSTVGQPVAGQATGGSYTLMSGYWQTFQAAVRSILLPFIVGNP